MDDKLDQILRAIGSLDNRVTGLETKITGLETRMISLENRTSDRMEVLEGTLLATMRSGFAEMNRSFNDLDIDLARNERKTEDNSRLGRRLNRRLSHLEDLGDD